MAAAVVSNADLIVTCNLKDFPADALEPHEIEVQTPDDFVLGLFDLNHHAVIEALECARTTLRKTPLSKKEYRSILAKLGLEKTVEEFEKFDPSGP